MTDDRLRDALLGIAEREGYRIESKEDFLICFNLEDDVEVTLRYKNLETFPYEIPEFELYGDFPEMLKGRPHISADGGICAFDKTKSRANPLNPYGLFVEALGKARSTVEASYRETNDDDFFDEFKFYWIYEQLLQEDFSSAVINLANVGHDCCELVAAKVPNNNRAFVVGDSEEAIKGKFVIDGDNAFFKCLYIPLYEEFRYPFPSTRQEWKEAFHSKSKFGDEYDRFLRKNGGEASFVMFSQPAKDGRILAAVVHNFNSLNPKAAINDQLTELMFLADKMSGNEYRKKARSISAQMASGRTVRVGVTDLTGDRLVNRGGVGRYSTIDSAAVVGCGSLGSHLADALAKSGIPKLVLIDEDRLETDNFARHLCGGLGSLYSEKVAVVADRIRENMPALKTVLKPEDVHKLLNESPCFIEEEDVEVVFLATGTFSTELHVLSVLKERSLSTTVASIWLEPYGVAGHALVFNDPSDLAELPFGEDLTYAESLVLNADELTKREAGCVSTYMPYSGSDALIFVNTFLKVFTEKMSDGNNYCFDWFGGISSSGRYPVKLRDDAYTHADYSCEVRKL